MNRLNKVVQHLEAHPDQSSSISRPTLRPIQVDNDFNQGDNKSNFYFTVDDFADRVFTREQRQFYEDNGYIVVRNLFNTDQVKYLYDRFEYLISNPNEAPRMVMMRDITQAKKVADPQKDWNRSSSNNPSSTTTKKTKKVDEKQIVKLQMWAREQGLWKNYASDKNLIKYISAFIGGDVRAMHFMSINKPPDHGTLSSRHPLHQDQWYFPFGPSQYIVCSWTALQKTNRNNGCLSVIPGTHKLLPGGKLLEHGYPQAWHGPVNKAYHGIQLDKNDYINNNSNNNNNNNNETDEYRFNKLLRNRIHLEMNPGDTVFFHPLLLHASGANLTHKSRRSISVHYASSTRCRWMSFKNVKQKKIEEEVIAMAKAKSGATIPYDIIWLMKSRHVTGKPGNLSQVNGIKSV